MPNHPLLSLLFYGSEAGGPFFKYRFEFAIWIACWRFTRSGKRTVVDVFPIGTNEISITMLVGRKANMFGNILKHRSCMEQSASFKGEKRKKNIDWRHLQYSIIETFKRFQVFKIDMRTLVVWPSNWCLNMKYDSFPLPDWECSVIRCVFFCHKKHQETVQETTVVKASIWFVLYKGEFLANFSLGSI